MKRISVKWYTGTVMSTPSTPLSVTPIAPWKLGAVTPDGAKMPTVERLCVMCCVPPPVSKAKDDSPVCGGVASGLP